MSTRSLYFIISGLSVIVVALAITLTVVLLSGHEGGDSHERGSEVSPMHRGSGMGSVIPGMGGSNGGNILPGANGAQELQQLMQLFFQFLQRQGIASPGQGIGGGPGGGIAPTVVPQPQPAPVRPGTAPTAPTP